MAHRTIALATELRERSAYPREFGMASRRERFDATTARGFEPLRAEPNGFLVHHLNHSVTLSRGKGASPPQCIDASVAIEAICANGQLAIRCLGWQAFWLQRKAGVV